jgi:decaprenyl-phosphate phosphoribosyltransferase
MRFKDFLRLIRASDYVKNLMVWVPLIFAQKIGELQLWWPLLGTFLAFCLVSSCVYIFNDISDREWDRYHRIKRSRPIASGKVSLRQACALAIFFFVTGSALGIIIEPVLFYILLLYTAQNILYSVLFKKVIILDILVIAFGFLLRVYAGGIVAGVPISAWLYVMTILLSLTLSLGKRLDDQFLRTLSDNAKKSRASYTEKSLLIMIGITLTGSMVTYCLYTLFGHAPLYRNPLFYVVTIIPVAFGLGRYAWHILKRKDIGNPVKLLYHDRWIQGSMIVWIALQLWFHA